VCTRAPAWHFAQSWRSEATSLTGFRAFICYFCFYLLLLGYTIPPPASAKPGKDDVKIEVKPFKGHRLEPPPAHAYTNPTELLAFYKVRTTTHARTFCH
jgi:hypothetical protein